MTRREAVYVSTGSLAIVLAVVAGLTLVGPRCTSVVGDRATGVVGRPAPHSAPIRATPTPAVPPHVTIAPITITVEPAPQEVVEQAASPATAVVERQRSASAVVYGAPWCEPCFELTPVLEAARERGYTVEYRDIIEQPTRHVVELPAAFVYNTDGRCVNRAVGLSACKSLLERYLP